MVRVRSALTSATGPGGADEEGRGAAVNLTSKVIVRAGRSGG